MRLGRCYLLAALERVSASEVALRAHVSQSAVHKWSEGAHLPSPPVRTALEVHLGIPAASWDVPKRKV